MPEWLATMLVAQVWLLISLVAYAVDRWRRAPFVRGISYGAMALFLFYGLKAQIIY